MVPCGGLLQRHIQSISAAHSAGLLHIVGSHPSSKSRGLCRTYAAAVVSEREQHSPVNGFSPPLDALNAAVASRRSLPTSPETLDLPPHGFDSIESALEALRQGHMVVVLDDEDRENEGDLIMAADKVTSADVEFIRKHTSGYICVGMEGSALDRLQLPLMIDSAENEEAMYTAFTVTVDAREGISTGISASDRARTLRMLASPATQPSQLRRPGHICPLRCREGGVLTRPGHTEAAVDLARLAGCQPAGVLCEVVNPEDGSMSRTPQLLEFAKQHRLRCITIADLVRYRLRYDVYGKELPATQAQ